MSTRKHTARKANSSKQHVPARPNAAKPQLDASVKRAVDTLAEPPSAPGASPAPADSGAGDTQPAFPQAAPSFAPVAPNPSLIPEGPFVPFATRALGASYGEYPKFMDESLERSLLQAQVTTGTGTQVINLTAPPLAIHASIVGIEGTGTVRQVTTSINTDGNVVVTGTDGITWSVLVITQRGNT